MEKGANINFDRAGGTSQRSGNPPAFVYPVDKSYQPLLTKLKQRGFTDAHTAEAAFMLQRVSYNHMSPYLSAAMNRPIANHPTVKEAHDLLAFDRRMQSVIFKYIGIFEAQMRAQYSHWMEALHGEFPHYNKELFLRQSNYETAIRNYETEVSRKLRNGNKRLFRIAKEHGGRLPIWDGVEGMTLGTLSMLFSNTKDPVVTKHVSDSFGASKAELSSWLKTISSVRNICAHFDHYMVRKEIPSTPLEIDELQCSNRSPFYIVLILLHLLSCEALFSDLNLIYTVTMRGDIRSVANSLLSSFGCTASAIGIPDNWESLMDFAAGGKIVFTAPVDE